MANWPVLIIEGDILCIQSHYAWVRRQYTRWKQIKYLQFSQKLPFWFIRSQRHQKTYHAHFFPISSVLQKRNVAFVLQMYYLIRGMSANTDLFGSLNETNWENDENIQTHSNFECDPFKYVI